MTTPNGNETKEQETMIQRPKNPVKVDRGKPFRQVLAAIVANLGTMNTGLVFGFSAVALPQLQSPDSLIKIDESQKSWIASLSSASTPVGCILSGWLMDRIGRRKTLILTEIPLILGWICIAMASNVYMIYIGRLLVGLGSGMVGAPARVYTSEVTQPHLRGMLSALAAVCISFGVLFQYTLGSYVTWNILSGVSAAIPAAALVLMYLMPESPNYLVANAKDEKARKNLARLRGSAFNVEGEINQMQTFAQKNNVKKASSFGEFWEMFKQPICIKPFTLLAIYFFMYQLSGVNAFTFYAVDIFNMVGTPWNKNTCTIILGLTRLSFTIVGCVASRRCGRRPLTFISGIGCGISVIGLAIYLYLKNMWDTSDPPVEPVLKWFPVMCIFVYTIACTLGFLIVPWVMIGEIYPIKVRGILGGLTTCTAHICVFVVVKTYPILIQILSSYGTFFLYGCVSLLGTIYLYFNLPETKNRTLQEIEDYFAGRIKYLGSAKNLSLTYSQNLINSKTLATVETGKEEPLLQSK